jgi:uncharacterized protein (TIGR02246 family)
MIKKLFLLIALSIACTGFALEDSDNKAIHQMIEGITDAWNHHEGYGFGDHYAQDADFVNIFGMVFSGKQEIEERHIKILETFLKGSIFEVTDLKLREAKPEVVIALVQWKVSNIQKPGQDQVSETMKGVFTHVFLKSHDKWEITASQNTLIPN